MRKTKIVCTLGPASDKREVLKSMIENGMNVARINCSHGNFNTQLEKVNLVKELREELKVPVGILLDTKGPEIRLQQVSDKVYLEEDSTFVIKCDDVIGNASEVSITYKELYKDVNIGTTILIDDGAVKLKVVEIIEKDIVCIVISSGFISSNKSMNVPDIKINLPSLTEKDINDIVEGVKNDIDYIGASFVRSKEDVIAIRNILDQYNSEIKIISKIENREGLDNLDEILAYSDGIMIARGDLGVEIPFYEVPIVQKDMIKATVAQGKVVITATQMMESMITNPNPTRAEVSDVANAIFDGTSAIMLSGETAMGKYPVECVQKMSEIAINVEESIDYWKRFRLREVPTFNYEFIINHALITTSLNIDIKGIFCYTFTGDTPRIVASMMPKCPIFVTTSNKTSYNQLSLVWGVNAIYAKKEKDAKRMILDDIDNKIKSGILNHEDIVIIAGGKYIENSKNTINKSVGGIFQV